MQKLSAFLLCMFITAQLLAQNKPKIISGIIKNTQNEFAAGATVKLMRSTDSVLIKTTVVNDNGRFQFKNLSSDIYFLVISGNAYKAYKSVHITVDEKHNETSLPVIILQPAMGTPLKEVVVVAKRPLLEQDIDRTIVNVDAMISAAANNTLEVLEKTPGVTVDNNGNISLKGKSGVLVLIDGRPTYMSGQDLAIYLRSLPGGILDKLELMENPPAKYDAAGGAIINIKLKRNRNPGITGSIASSYSQGVKPGIYQAFNLNYNHKKINWYGGVTYNYNGQYGNDFYDRKFYSGNGELTSQVLLENKMVNKTSGFAERIGLDYAITKKTTIGFLLGVQSQPRKSNFDFKSNSYNDVFVLDSSSAGSSNNSFKWNRFSSNLNFTHKFNDKGKELSGDVNYLTYHSPGNQYFNNPNSNNFQYDQESTIDIFNIKADYTQSFKNKMNLELGIKSSLVTNDNDSKYFDAAYSQVYYRSNHFIFDENINSAYVNTRKNWKRLGLQLGMRMENTHLKGHQLGNAAVTETYFTQHFTDVFPTVFASYKLDSTGKNTLTLNFGQRVNRPNYQQFNPFIVYKDNYSYSTGNPLLKPQYNSQLRIAYQHGQLLNIALAYNSVNDLIFQTTEVINNIYVTKSNNAGRGYMVVLGINLNVSPYKWWRMNNNIQVAHLEANGMIGTEPFHPKTESARLNFSNQFTINKSWSAELSAYYTARDIGGQSITSARYRVWAAVQKKILKNKGSLKLNVEDIFHSWITEDNSLALKQSSFYRHSENDTRRIGIAFSYSFGKEIFARKRKHTDNAADAEKTRVE
ncbi:outer membrane beta-barrel protein [Ferruginibacter sp.]